MSKTKLREDDEHYLKKHGKPITFSMADRRRMRQLFDALDVDKSGQITCDELLGPLLGAGMAHCEADVRAFHSGPIDFEAFCSHKKLLSLHDDTLSMAVRFSLGRRRRLLQAIFNSLPNTARIEELRNEEGLQRERRKLQRANAANAKLISALEHAVRIDQATVEPPREARQPRRYTPATSFLARQRRPRDMMPLRQERRIIRKGRPYLIV